MLVPLQTSGAKPPLFFVHGYLGIMFSIGSRFAAALGSDQPVYVINANGTDGRQPVIEDVHEMVLAYVEQIRGARPVGPIRIGGMCQGCLIAIEIVRRLQAEGRQTGPVILVDPSSGYEKRRKTLAVQPDRLYQELRGWYLEKMANPSAYEELPFDYQDPRQLHWATLTAAAAMVAFNRYVPRPFAGPVEAILSAKGAPEFFHPQMPWCKLLPGSRMVHVTPWRHHELFKAGHKTVTRLMKFMLEEELASQNLAEQQMQPTLISESSSESH